MTGGTISYSLKFSFSSYSEAPSLKPLPFVHAVAVWCPVDDVVLEVVRTKARLFSSCISLGKVSLMQKQSEESLLLPEKNTVLLK